MKVRKTHVQHQRVGVGGDMPPEPSHAKLEAKDNKNGQNLTILLLTKKGASSIMVATLKGGN